MSTTTTENTYKYINKTDNKDIEAASLKLNQRQAHALVEPFNSSHYDCGAHSCACQVGSYIISGSISHLISTKLKVHTFKKHDRFIKEDELSAFSLLGNEL